MDRIGDDILKNFKNKWILVKRKEVKEELMIPKFVYSCIDLESISIYLLKKGNIFSRIEFSR
jgi:hypothetical protein